MALPERGVAVASTDESLSVFVAAWCLRRAGRDEQMHVVFCARCFLKRAGAILTIVGA